MTSIFDHPEFFSPSEPTPKAAEEPSQGPSEARPSYIIKTVDKGTIELFKDILTRLERLEQRSTRCICRRCLRMGGF